MIARAFLLNVARFFISKRVQFFCGFKRLLNRNPKQEIFIMTKIVSETKFTRLETQAENCWRLTIIPTGQVKNICGNDALVELMIAEDKILEAWRD